MSEEVPEEIRQGLMNELKKIESSSDLTDLTVLSRTGMRIATSTSSTIDADPTSASSAALIDVGVRFVNNVEHGNLKEILLRAKHGYAILMHIDNKYMTFAGLSNTSRIGYYLEFLRVKCKAFAYILAGGNITDELKAEIEASEKKAKEEDISLDALFETDKSADNDLNAMDDVLAFLKDWGGDDVPNSAADVSTGIVGIDEDLMVGSASDELANFLSDTGDEEGGVVGIPDSAHTSTAATPSKPQAGNFKIYDDEVPPVPLEDVEALDIGDGSYSEHIASEEQSSSTPQPTQTTQPAQETQTNQAASTNDIPHFDEEPDFDSIDASEYEEFELEEDDALLDALSDLGYSKKKKK